MVQGATSNTMLFEHSSAPASVKASHSKTKYRDDETPLPLSSDPRVMRGSTTVLARKIAASKKMSKKLLSQSSSDDNEYGRQLSRPTYQFEVKGHVGPDIDLTPYLVASDDGVQPKKKEVISQTDKFKDRPVTPDYQPRKTGIDGETQVEDVRELFDFDIESQPIVSVIVSKTLEQALYEVQHEEEMEALENQANEFHTIIEKEKQWQNAREAESLAELREHSREMSQAQIAYDERLHVISTVAGNQMIRQILPGVFDNVVEDLYDNKTWRRPERANVEDNCYFPSRDGLRQKYKANGECKKIIEELAMEASKLYEDKTSVLKKPIDGRCILLHMKHPEPEPVAEGEEAPAPIKVIDPIKIYDNVSMIDIIKVARAECAEREIPMYESLTLAGLDTYFYNLVGRTIAQDGAIINFEKWIPNNDLFYPVA